MKIKLTKGKSTLVSPEDYKKLSKYSWYFSCTGYAMRGKWENGKTNQFLMHHDILGKTPRGFDIDHINRDKLDNRRENLRKVPHHINLLNRPKQKNNTSGIKGVFYCKEKNRVKRWMVRIQVNKKSFYLGRFLTKKEALTAQQKFIQERNILYA